MEHIEQIRELFYSNNIELALQLIKGQGYELREVLDKIYNMFVESGNDLDIGFVLVNGRGFEVIEFYRVPYPTDCNCRLWIHDIDYVKSNTDECIDELYKWLIENYG